MSSKDPFNILTKPDSSIILKITPRRKNQYKILTKIKNKKTFEKILKKHKKGLLTIKSESTKNVDKSINNDEHNKSIDDLTTLENNDDSSNELKTIEIGNINENHTDSIYNDTNSKTPVELPKLILKRILNNKDIDGSIKRYFKKIDNVTIRKKANKRNTKNSTKRKSQESFIDLSDDDEEIETPTKLPNKRVGIFIERKDKRRKLGDKVIDNTFNEEVNNFNEEVNEDVKTFDEEVIEESINELEEKVSKIDNNNFIDEEFEKLEKNHEKKEKYDRFNKDIEEESINESINKSIEQGIHEEFNDSINKINETINEEIEKNREIVRDLGEIKVIRNESLENSIGEDIHEEINEEVDRDNENVNKIDNNESINGVDKKEINYNEINKNIEKKLVNELIDESVGKEIDRKLDSSNEEIDEIEKNHEKIKNHNEIQDIEEKLIDESIDKTINEEINKDNKLNNGELDGVEKNHEVKDFENKQIDKSIDEEVNEKFHTNDESASEEIYKEIEKNHKKAGTFDESMDVEEELNSKSIDKNIIEEIHKELDENHDETDHHSIDGKIAYTTNGQIAKDDASINEGNSITKKITTKQSSQIDNVYEMINDVELIGKEIKHNEITNNLSILPQTNFNNYKLLEAEEFERIDIDFKEFMNEIIVDNKEFKSNEIDDEKSESNNFNISKVDSETSSEIEKIDELKPKIIESNDIESDEEIKQINVIKPKIMESNTDEMHENVNKFIELTEKYSDIEAINEKLNNTFSLKMNDQSINEDGKIVKQSNLKVNDNKELEKSIENSKDESDNDVFKNNDSSIKNSDNSDDVEVIKYTQEIPSQDYSTMMIKPIQEPINISNTKLIDMTNLPSDDDDNEDETRNKILKTPNQSTAQLLENFPFEIPKSPPSFSQYLVSEIVTPPSPSSCSKKLDELSQDFPNSLNEIEENNDNQSIGINSSDSILKQPLFSRKSSKSIQSKLNFTNMKKNSINFKVTCKECFLTFIKNNKNDEVFHKDYHNKYVYGINCPDYIGKKILQKKFPPNQKKVLKKVQRDGIIKKVQFDKKNEVLLILAFLKIINKELNAPNDWFSELFGEDGKNFNKKTCEKASKHGTIFIYIFNRKIVGLLSFEKVNPLKNGTKLLNVSTQEIMDLAPNSNLFKKLPKAVFGISRIFILKKFRRNGLGLIMLYTALEELIYGMLIKKFEICWSQPSFSGLHLAKQFNLITDIRSKRQFLNVYDEDEVGF